MRRNQEGCLRFAKAKYDTDKAAYDTPKQRATPTSANKAMEELERRNEDGYMSESVSQSLPSSQNRMPMSFPMVQQYT